MISSLLSLLSSLFPLPSALVLRPSDLDRACLSLLAQGLSQTLLQFSCSSVVHYLIASRLISSLSSLLSSLFLLRENLFLSGHQMSAVTSRGPFEFFLALFSLVFALFPLSSSLCSRPLLSLLLISQIALRTCHIELCIRPSNPLPTASTLCLTIPGPAECAKRLNNNQNNNDHNQESIINKQSSIINGDDNHKHHH